MSYNLLASAHTFVPGFQPGTKRIPKNEWGRGRTPRPHSFFGDLQKSTRGLSKDYKPKLVPLGDSALLVKLGEEIDLAINRREGTPRPHSFFGDLPEEHEGPEQGL